MNNNYFDNTKNNELKPNLKELETMQMRMNEVMLEKEELQKQLLNTSKFLDCTIIKQKSINSQLEENYDLLWKKFKTKKNEFDKQKNVNECLNIKLDELNKKCENLQCQLKESDKKYQCLEELNYKLEQCLNEEKYNFESLDEKYKNELKCSERMSIEQKMSTQKLAEITVEFCKEKEEHRKLKSKIEILQKETSKKVENMKLAEMKLIKSKDSLDTEIQIQNKRYAELIQTLCITQRQQKDLQDVLDKSNEKIVELKQKIETNKREDNEIIDKLQNEKISLEKKTKESEKTIKANIEQLKTLSFHNEQLQSQVTDLQYKFDTAVNNRDEKEKRLNERIEQLCEEKKQIINEIALKNQTNNELEKQMLEIKNMHQTEIENANNLRIKLNNIQREQTVAPTHFDRRSNSAKTDGKNYQLSDRFTKVLGELQLDGKLEVISNKFDSCNTNNLNEKNQNFEKLLIKYNSVINNV